MARMSDEELNRRVSSLRIGIPWDGQCVHAWDRDNKCPDCGATCKRDDEGKIVEYSAGLQH